MFVLIPLFPLIGVLVNGLFGIKYFSKRTVHSVAVAAVGLSFLASAVTLAGLLRPGASPVLIRTIATWVPETLVRLAGGSSAPFAIELAFRYDSLAAVMTLVVTGVGLLIHIYSLGYMAHDRSSLRNLAS